MQERQKELQRFQRDIDYYRTHQEELLQQYPDQWVAIFNEQVVGAATDLDQLLGEIKGKGVPIGRSLVEYVTTKAEILILPS